MDSILKPQSKTKFHNGALLFINTHTHTHTHSRMGERQKSHVFSLSYDGTRRKNEILRIDRGGLSQTAQKLVSNI